MSQLTASPPAHPPTAHHPIQTELGIQLADQALATLACKNLGLVFGWDFAQHGQTPPLEYLFDISPLRQG